MCFYRERRVMVTRWRSNKTLVSYCKAIRYYGNFGTETWDSLFCPRRLMIIYIFSFDSPLFFSFSPRNTAWLHSRDLLRTSPCNFFDRSRFHSCTHTSNISSNIESNIRYYVLRRWQWWMVSVLVCQCVLSESVSSTDPDCVCAAHRHSLRRQAFLHKFIANTPKKLWAHSWNLNRGPLKKRWRKFYRSGECVKHIFPKIDQVHSATMSVYGMNTNWFDSDHT